MVYSKAPARFYLFYVMLVVAIITLLVFQLECQERKYNSRSEIEGGLRELNLEMALLQERAKVISGIEAPFLKKKLAELDEKEAKAKDEKKK